VKKDEYIDEFYQLPSITGKDVIDLEKYAELPRAKTYGNLEGFLEVARKSKKDVHACFIIAEWGEGKTSIYEGFLQKPEIIKSDLVIPISTKRLIVHIKEKAASFSDTGSLGIRFFACLLYTIKDTIDNDLVNAPPFNNIKIKPKEEQQATLSFIKDALMSIYNVLPKDSRVFLFIDEFEDILDESADVRKFIIGGLLEVINGYPQILCQEPFAGRFHLLIAVTPPAYEKLKAETYADRQRLFGQRILSIELEKLDRKNAYKYILGILRYCWQGKLPKIPFLEPGMFNAIYVATLGNPRSIINVVEKLLTYAKIHAPDGKIKVISSEDFVKALSGLKIEVYGGEVNLLDKNSLLLLYDKIEQKCKERELNANECINILHMLLSNLSPISIGDLGEKFGLKEKVIRDCLSVLAESFNELWNINRPFIYFKKIVGETREICSKLITTQAPSNISKIISALEFYEFDQSHLSFQSTLFVPYQPLGILAYENRSLFQNYIDFFTSFSPELRSEDEIIRLVDRCIFDKVEVSDEEYVMLSPAVINIFYPSPSIFFLDFIEDLNKRFEVGIKLMRNLTDFEKEFHEGVIRLLQDGCENVKVGVSIESYGYGRDIRVINILYEGEYHLRAYVLPLLKTSKEDFHEKIKTVIDDMKIAHIPLLMIFSWNPLPNEIKGILETLLIPETSFKAERISERVFYCLEFPLTFIQCQQICGYIIAQKSKYMVKEEKWKVRASKILDEIKFEDNLRGFILEGVSAGYTIKPLILRELKQNDIPGILRTLLVTEGNIKMRYEQIREIEKKFKVYGKRFPVCPLDIESESSFEKYVNELKENGLIKVEDDSLKLDITPIERRILSILREYDGVAKEDDINKLFISTMFQGHPITVDVHLKMLMERRKIKFDKDVFRIVDLKELDDIFEKLKKEINNYKRKYAQFQYGYLASIKQRDINAIIIKDFIEEIARIADNLDKIRFSPEYEEIRMRRQILLELLVNQLHEVITLAEEFYQEFLRKVSSIRMEIKQVKMSLDGYEKSINNLKLEDKIFKIKEKKLIEEKEKLIEELENKIYSSKEVINYSLELEEKAKYFDNLYQEFGRKCLIFDVKIIQIMDKYDDLKKIVENVKQISGNIEGLIDNFVKLKEILKEHEILVFKCNNKLSSLIQDWIKQNIESVMR
jgi:hypothetical protein